MGGDDEQVDQSFDERDLALFPRYDPTMFLVRALTNAVIPAGRCCWCSGDLDMAERLGQVAILQRPILTGEDAERWRAAKRDAALRERLRRAGISVPDEGDQEQISDWTADKGGSHLFKTVKRLF